MKCGLPVPGWLVALGARWELPGEEEGEEELLLLETFSVEKSPTPAAIQPGPEENSNGVAISKWPAMTLDA